MILFSPNTDTVRCISGNENSSKGTPTCTYNCLCHSSQILCHCMEIQASHWTQNITNCPSYVDSMTTYMLHGETLDANSLENWLGHSKDSFYTINIHPYKMYSLYSYHQYNLPQLVLF